MLFPIKSYADKYDDFVSNNIGFDGYINYNEAPSLITNLHVGKKFKLNHLGQEKYFIVWLVSEKHNLNISCDEYIEGSGRPILVNNTWWYDDLTIQSFNEGYTGYYHNIYYNNKTYKAYRALISIPFPQYRIMGSTCIHKDQAQWYEQFYLIRLDISQEEGQYLDDVISYDYPNLNIQEPTLIDLENDYETLLDCENYNPSIHDFAFGTMFDCFMQSMRTTGLFSAFTEVESIPDSGNSTIQFTTSNYGTQSWDFSDYSDSFGTLKIVLLIIAGFVSIKIIFLKPEE